MCSICCVSSYESRVRVVVLFSDTIDAAVTTAGINEFPYGLFVSLPFYDSPRERFVSLESSLQTVGKRIFP